MAGDDWGMTPTTMTNTVSASQPTTWNDDRGNYGLSYETIIYNEYSRCDKEIKRIAELLRKQYIEEMKESWNFFKNQFKSIFPPMRPSVQLRGVSFNGRGWA